MRNNNDNKFKEINKCQFRIFFQTVDSFSFNFLCLKKAMSKIEVI